MVFALAFSLAVFGAVTLLGALVLKCGCFRSIVGADVAGKFVAAALEGLMVKDLVMLDTWTLAGWTGVTWRSHGQQVGVVMQQTGPDQVTLWCCSRPRLATTVLDFDASKRSAGLLAAAITQAVGNDRVEAA